MAWPRFLALAGIFVLAAIIRLFCLPVRPFFCDAPRLVDVVTDGEMKIQFPGYVPFCLAIKGLSFLTGTPFASMVLFSFLCGMGAMLYVVLFAYDRGGFSAALVSSVVMGFSVMMVYFSSVGTFYTTEMMAMSGMIYHGNRVLTKNQPNHYYGALGWYLFGCLMRSLSFPFTGLALLFLLWKRPFRREIVVTVAALILGTCFFLELSSAYFGSLHQLWASQIIGVALSSSGRPVWLALNWLRSALYLIWSLNLFLLLGVGVLWLSRRHLNGNLRVFFLLLTVPYACVLTRYIPHAGYFCLLLPALAAAPWVADRRFWLDTKPIAVALVLSPLFLAQTFLAHPIAVTGPVSLVSNVYCLMYTRAGIKSSMHETLSSLAKKNHVEDNYIPLAH